MKKKICVIILALAMILSFFACGQKSKNEAVLQSGKGEESTCTLSVSCEQILENMSSISEEKKDLIPDDGIIYSPKEVAFVKGDTAFDVLEREMKENNIHFDFEDMPMYDSVYIKGIGNIYEFDLGELSGWTYLVNGKSPMVAISQYEIKDGDRIELVYSCNLMQ